MAKSRPNDEDDEQDRLRRKRSKGGALSRVVPYRNVMALVAYYCGFGGLISILGSIVLLKAFGESFRWALVVGFVLGALLALAAAVLGVLGLNYVSANPEARGTGHAVTGIVLGILEIFAIIGLLLFR